MKTIYTFIVASFLILPGSQSYAAFSSDDNGTTAVAFLSLGVGARALAMGEAYSAVTAGSDALFWNPAGLAKSQSAEILINHQPYFDSLDYNMGSVSIPMGKSHIALGYAGISYADIDTFNGSGQKVGSFEASDQQFLLGYATGFESLNLGVTGKFIRSKIDDVSGDAYAVDLGLGFSNPLTSKLDHALTIQNLGSKMKFDSESDPLPLSTKFGSALNLMPNLTLALDLIFPNKAEMAGAVGGEYRLPLGEGVGLALRAGYNTRSNDVDDISGLGIGGGFNLAGIYLDYAWVPQGDVGDNQIFTVNYKFGSNK